MKQRFIWLDYLRAIAAILVVLLHTSAPYLYEIQTIDVLSWLVGNFVDSFTRVSVPLFFMISGYLFFGKRKPTLKNYIRIISALAFYSFISLLYLKLYRGVPIYGLVKDIAFTPVFYHLWFFYTILTIYIICSFLTVRDIAGNRVIFLISA